LNRGTIVTVGQVGLTQARKKRVLEEVRKQRQRRTIITVVIVAILIGTIGYGVYALTQSKGGGNFPFPCSAEVVTVHVHPWLQIFVNTGNSNVSVPIPAAVGILDPQFQASGGEQVAVGGSCFEPMHTHDASGIIHLEAPSVSSQYTLGAFFTIWQVTYPNGVSINGVTRPITLNSTDIFGFKIGQGHTLSLVIDKGMTSFQNFTVNTSLDMMRYDYCSSQSTSSPCFPTATGNPQYPGGYPYGTGHTISIFYS
jgi:hypothetical protein